MANIKEELMGLLLGETEVFSSVLVLIRKFRII